MIITTVFKNNLISLGLPAKEHIINTLKNGNPIFWKDLDSTKLMSMWRGFRDSWLENQKKEVSLQKINYDF